MPSFTPVNPDILFQLQQPNLAGALESGIKLGAFNRMAPLEAEQQRLANQQAQLTLRDLMDPTSLVNQMKQAELQYKQGAIAGQPTEQQLKEAQIKNYGLQAEDYYAKEAEKNRLIAAESDLAGIAKKYYDPDKKSFNIQGFVSEALTKYPLIASEKGLLELANKFKYGFDTQTEEKSLWKPEGARVVQNGRLVQPERNIISGAYRMTDLGPAPEKPVGGTSGKQGQGEYIIPENIPSGIRSYFKNDQLVFKKSLPDIQKKTAAAEKFLTAGQKALNIYNSNRLAAINPTTKEYAQLKSTISEMNTQYRELAQLGVPNLGDAALTESFINDPTKLSNQVKSADESIKAAMSLIHSGYNSDMTQFGFSDIPMGGLIKIKQRNQTTQQLPLANPKYGKVYTTPKGREIQWIKGGEPNKNDPSGWIEVRVK